MQPLWKIIPVHSAESSRWTLCWPISIGCCQLHWYESFMHLKFFHGRINWIKLKTQALVHLVLCVTCWVKTRHFPANIEFKLEAILSTQVVFQPNSVFAPCYRRLALYHTELWNLALLLNYKDDISSNSHGTCFQKTRFHKDGWLESSKIVLVLYGDKWWYSVLAYHEKTIQIRMITDGQ